MKEYFSDKKYGFFVTLGAMLLSIITAIVYSCIYAKTKFMSWAAFAIILVGVVGAAALIVFKLYRYAPALLLVANFVGFLLYVYYIYYYVSATLVGIQFSGFPSSFVANVVFFALTLTASIACTFMAQVKREEKA